MDDVMQCNQCGTRVNTASLRGGLCPVCLLKRGLESNTIGLTSLDQSDAIKGWSPPTVEELTSWFPELDILELIGRGGMGAVYKAREKQLDRWVALKIMPPEIGREQAFAQRFAREAQAMAKLSHSNIVAIFSFGKREAQGSGPGSDLYFFIMEFVDGVSLRQLLDAGTVSPREALAIVPQICDALQYAHDRGVVHRDIKPENILLMRSGQVKIADFGLAKLIGVHQDAPSIATTSTPEQDHARQSAPPSVTQPGMKVMGTPQYMAPEQAVSPSMVDHRADIYALGVVFYQMLTGELPKENLAPPSQKVVIDVRLDEVVLRALEREPTRRYQQASELKTQVETIATTSVQAVTVDSTANSSPPQGPIASTGSPATSRHRQHKRWWVAGFTFTAICALANAMINFSRYANWGSHDYAIMGTLWLIGMSGFLLGAWRHYQPATSAAWATSSANTPTVAPKTTHQSAPSMTDGDTPARVSRQAVIGAMWSPWCVIMLFMTMGIRNVVSTAPYQGPTWWQIVMAVVISGVGVTAPLGTTLLGVIAIAHIRRSAGRLYGMGLALFDALLYPLLILTALIIWLWYHLYAILASAPNLGWGAITQPSYWLAQQNFGLVFALGMTTALPIQLLICLLLWRKVRQPIVGDALNNLQRSKAVRTNNIVKWGMISTIVMVLPLMVWAATTATKENESPPADVATVVRKAVQDISTLNDRDPQVLELLKSVKRLPESETVSEVAKYLESDRNTIRRAAIFVLWKAGFADISSAVPMLKKFLAHEENYTRSMSSLALGQAKAADAFDDLVKLATKDESSMVRRSAVYALGLFGDQRAKPTLQEALKDADHLVRNNAEAALTLLEKSGGENAAQSVPRVIETTPAAFHDQVDPALDKLTVTFDQPMMDKSWSWTGGGDTFPQRTGDIFYDSTRTICTMPVKLEAGRVYWVGINSPSHHNFKTEERVPARRYVILFATRSSDGQPTPIPESMIQRARQINVMASSTTHAATKPDQAAVQAAAGQVLAAIAASNDTALEELSSDRIRGWSDALPIFAKEMRQQFQRMAGKPFNMHVSESRIDANWAMVRCDGPAELKGACLILTFFKAADGWQLYGLNNAPAGTSLEKQLHALLASPAVKFPEIALAFVEQLIRSEFQAATESFDKAMLEAIPAEKLEALWKQLSDAGGQFVSHGRSPQIKPQTEYIVVYVPCVWERNALDLKVVYHKHTTQIAGLWLVKPGED